MTALVGTGRLLRLALRRDRVVLPAWLVAIGALTGTVVASIVGLYPTATERAAAARFSAGNPLTRAFDGPASGSELGALVAVESTVVLAVAVGLMAAQTVVRHTRRDEEAGRAELLGSAVVGRHARLVTAVLVAVAASVAVGGVVAAVHLSQGFDGTGAVAAGAAITSVGVVFAAVAAVTAQLVSTSRAANGLAGAVLGAAFLLRAIGDAMGSVTAAGDVVISAWPSWLSPIGWAQQVRPHGGDQVEVLLLALVTTGLLLAGAVRLAERRDLGAGILAARPGPARASRWLRTPGGLTWRLQRGVLVAWSVGMAVMGAVFGAVGESVEELLETSPEFAEILAAVGAGGDLVDRFLALAVGILAIIASGAVVQVLLRARAEEAAGRLEPVLATAVSRRRWLLGHVAVAAGGGAVVLVLLGASGAAAFTALTGDGAAGLGMLAGAVTHLPAVWVLVGVVTAAVAFTPRWAPAIGWSVLAVSLVLGQFGGLFGLPEGVLAISPFHHVPAVPAESASVVPLLVLTVLAASLVTAATAWFVRRDLVATA